MLSRNLFVISLAVLVTVTVFSLPLRTTVFVFSSEFSVETPSDSNKNMRVDDNQVLII